MNETLLISILAASITAGTPILFAALGELISERAGVTNLGVDGMMLVGACAGFIAAQQTGSLLSGVGMALLAGSLMALIHAFLTVTLRANQVVSGLALTLFGTGLSGYLGLDYVGQQATVVFSKLAVPGLSEIPVLGPVLFRQDLLVYCSYILVAAVAFYLYRTRAGCCRRQCFWTAVFICDHGRCFSRFGRRVFVAGLCSLLAGKYDGRTRLDRGGTCNFCSVGSLACAAWFVSFRRH